MLAENGIFFFHDAGQQLFVRGRGGEFGKLGPADMDAGMQQTFGTSKLRLHRLTQEGLEHFVLNYGGTYQVLYLDDCRFIRDFSSLGDLVKLEAIRIEHCTSTDRLWDFSRNDSLKILSIVGAKKIVSSPTLLRTSHTLEEVRLWGGDSSNRHVLESLSCFHGMKSLRRIDLNSITLLNRNMETLSSLPALEEFHFDAGMLPTEEIAWICAKYPSLYGDCLGVFTANDASCMSDIRICGHRKPGLNLPEDQQKLDKYTAQFEALVKEYQSVSP